MKKTTFQWHTMVMLVGLLLASDSLAQELYVLPKWTETRWASFENPTAGQGLGGAENKNAKGHPFEFMAPGETKVLLDVAGAGIVQRIWMTVRDRTPVTLRSLRLEMYWDGSSTPAVSAPLGDFFGVGLGRMTAFQSALFTDPEGRTFNCYIPMPFRKGARIILVNESKKSVMLFYDVNFQKVNSLPKNALYLHAYWSRETRPTLGKDFAILPLVGGRGRYLGMNMGIVTNPVYQKSWWGEGEVKIYLDGDTKLPTLNGTGTEDYIGAGWGEGVFAHEFQGCLVADTAAGKWAGEWAFYRYHIPDPVYFQKNCRVTIQLMGGDILSKVREFKANGAPLIPVTVSDDKVLIKLLELDKPLALEDNSFLNGWVNFYRQDDVSAIAYFYLDKPYHDLPMLPAVQERTLGLKADPPKPLRKP